MYKKSKLVFIEDLQQHNPKDGGAAYFTAKALVIAEDNGQYYGTEETLRISDLILKQSSFIYDGVHSREAHKLYTWPRNLGDMAAWAASKKAFLEQHVMHFPIQIHSVQEQQHLNWEFITPEQFKKTPSDIQASAAFQHYLDHIGDYFFLRKERNDPV